MDADNKPMRIAIFDHLLIPNNPIGSCHYKILTALADEHEFVVFATKFENPRPDRIRWVRVYAPTRPQVLLHVISHFMQWLAYAWYRMTGGKRFDCIQTVESNSLIRADIAYAHFCHRRFLREHWPKVRTGGMRGILRVMDHRIRMMTEGFVYGRAKHVIAVSKGLVRELEQEYPQVAGKISLLSNPVDLKKMDRPADFDRAGVRRAMGFGESDLVLCFIALGQFERKGLPLVMEAMTDPSLSDVKLNVVGGETDLVNAFRRKADAMGLGNRVVLNGKSRDVRPNLWACDAFIFPSVYEAFPLVSLEASAGGVPIIGTRINGLEELVCDGVNGFFVERTVAGVKEGIERFKRLSMDDRKRMSESAKQDVQRFSLEQYLANWRDVYRRKAGESGALVGAADYRAGHRV